MFKNDPPAQTPRPPDPGASLVPNGPALEKLLVDLRALSQKLVRPDEVDDLVADVLLALMETVRRLTAERASITNVGGLAHRILVRCASRVVAARRRIPLSQGLDDIPAEYPVQELPAHTSEANVPRIGRRQRIILSALREGLSMVEAAARAGLPRKEADRVAKKLAARIHNRRVFGPHFTPPGT